MKDSIAKDGSTEEKLTGVVGYLLPLAASIPPLPVWSGLMAIPFLSYILLMLTTNPSLIPTAIGSLFFGDIAYSVSVIGGFVLLLCSAIYLHLGKVKAL